VLGHGSGGKLSHALIERVFRNAFDNPILRVGDDSAVVAVEDDRQQAQGRIAISTDSHVVSPLFFPGGDIGRLAICGTVNDLAMNGARPLYLTVGFILEEGLAISELEAIVQSMKIAATEAGIQIVAGDTKVVQKGKADGVYINTTGIGWIDPHMNISGANAQAGDVVIISGTVGDHGMAVLQARGDLGFTANITSDVAPLNHLTQVMMNICPEIHVLRDPTRGGLATTLNEIAAQSKVGIILDEQAIPVQPVVASACEMLGFDPLYVANEGKLIAIAPEQYATDLMAAMNETVIGRNAAVIGKVIETPAGKVLLKTILGSTRILDSLSGELLPRIC
jgi:hydrogenase expression/formation protein HypE